MRSFQICFLSPLETDRGGEAAGLVTIATTNPQVWTGGNKVFVTEVSVH